MLIPLNIVIDFLNAAILSDLTHYSGFSSEGNSAKTRVIIRKGRLERFQVSLCVSHTQSHGSLRYEIWLLLIGYC